MSAGRIHLIVEAEFAARSIHQLEIRTYQIFIAGYQVQSLESRRDDGVGDLGGPQQHLVQAGSVRVLRNTHSGCSVTLGVGVDYKNAQVVGG